ncbi:AMP-binding protein, partial [Paraburkholderia fungorum]|uniref:AMP-binding protein n=1 Tax=Paraburkholderia fungorum TaxID=134537 RepID=UPI0038BD6A06
AMAQFELTLNTTEGSDGTMSASFVYARELFDAQTVERLAEHYVASLNALVSGRVSTVADVELMNDAERAGLFDFSRSDADYGEALPVHRVIEAQVRRTPDAQAVLFGDTALTYAELNVRANQLAHRLSAQGVGPDVRVGIAVERSVEMVVGLLAIMKAGGAYVPFDPSYPAARLAYMMAD